MRGRVIQKMDFGFAIEPDNSTACLCYCNDRDLTIGQIVEFYLVPSVGMFRAVIMVSASHGEGE
jgi:hypothetical protein